MKDSNGIKVTVKTRLEKYPEGVSQEDINTGRIKPIEVIESEDILVPTPDQLQELQTMGLNMKEGGK